MNFNLLLYILSYGISYLKSNEKTTEENNNAHYDCYSLGVNLTTAALNLRWYFISEFPFLFVFQVVSIISLVAMIPFFFYISKEQLLVAYDEYVNNSLSLMVDRVRNELGDPRFFLAQLV